MDKQCRLMPYIATTVLSWQHFSRLVPAVAGGSVEHGCTYLDLHWIQLFIIIPNFHQKHINRNHYCQYMKNCNTLFRTSNMLFEEKENEI